MKILVPISKVPDTTSKISFTDNNTKFNADGVQFIMNPTDEWFALVRGLELKEKFGGSVTVINVGRAENDPIIRKALAIGADNAVRVDADATTAFFVAKQISAYAEKENFDLIFTGKETIDHNGSQVGAMIAELLNLPFVGLATKVELEDKTAVISREIEGGQEIVEVQIPMVISVQKGVSEQRIPNMRGIMQARTKPLTTIPPVDTENHITLKSFDLPPQKSECKLVDPENVEELVKLLHEEAKVI